MLNPQQFRLKLTQNLAILQEREAKYATNPPLELLNQIDDHRQAIALTEQAIKGQLAPEEWWAQLQPLLLPFWQGLSQSVLTALLDAAQSSTPASRVLREAALPPLRQSPKGAMLVDGFTDDPDTYAKPVQKELADTLKTNPDLAEQLHRLLAQVEAAAAQSGGVYRASISGSGAIAQGPGARAVTATGGGIAIGGSVKGDINLGGRNKNDE